MSIGDGAFHFSASGFPDAKDLQEATRIRLAAWHIVTGVDVPYCAGYSQYPRKRIVYIDKDVPQFWTDARGKQLDVWHGPLFWHESIECDLLNAYPDEHYAGAHTIATYVENMYVQALDSFAFYVHRNGIRYNLDVVALGGKPNALHKLLAQLYQ